MEYVVSRKEWEVRQKEIRKQFGYHSVKLRSMRFTAKSRTRILLMILKEYMNKGERMIEAFDKLDLKYISFLWALCFSISVWGLPMMYELNLLPSLPYPLSLMSNICIVALFCGTMILTVYLLTRIMNVKMDKETKKFVVLGACIPVLFILGLIMLFVIRGM